MNRAMQRVSKSPTKHRDSPERLLRESWAAQPWTHDDCGLATFGKSVCTNSISLSVCRRNNDVFPEATLQLSTETATLAVDIRDSFIEKVKTVFTRNCFVLVINLSSRSWLVSPQGGGGGGGVDKHSNPCAELFGKMPRETPVLQFAFHFVNCEFPHEFAYPVWILHEEGINQWCLK